MAMQSFGRLPPGTRFVGAGEKQRRSPRLSAGMGCPHDGFHSICTSYDRRRGLLVYHWTCERCGTRLSEARRERYRPSFDSRGNERFLGQATLRMEAP
jgi:hypothetical protein